MQFEADPFTSSYISKPEGEKNGLRISIFACSWSFWSDNVANVGMKGLGVQKLWIYSGQVAYSSDATKPTSLLRVQIYECSANNHFPAVRSAETVTLF